MFAGPLVSGYHEIHLIALLEHFPSFDLGGVEEQLLALFHLEAEEPKLSWKQKIKR